MLKQFSNQVILCFLFVTFFAANASAQVEVIWEKEVDKNILWQQVTTLGSLIMSTPQGLQKVDAETGADNWNIMNLANISEDKVTELLPTPYLKIEKANSVMLLNQYNGNIVFDSDNIRMKTVSSFSTMESQNLLMVDGKDKSGDPFLVAVDINDGSVKWKFAGDYGRVITTEDMNNGQILVVTLFDNYALDAATGKEIWKKVNSQQSKAMDKMGGFGSFMKKLSKEFADEMAAESNVEITYFGDPAKDIFYLVAQSSEQVEEQQSGFYTSRSEKNTKTVTKYACEYNAFQLSTGELLWEDEYIETDGPLGAMGFLDGGIMIMETELDRKNRSTLNLYDYKTADKKWGKRGRGIKVKGVVYDYYDLGDKLILASSESGKNYFQFLDHKNGKLIYDDPTEIEGSVKGFIQLDNALLYITDGSINILDLKTGNLKWPFNVRTTRALTAERDGKIYVFDNSSKTVKAIDKSTGKIDGLFSQGLSFQGGEAPANLEARADGIVLYSDQNIAKYGYDGTMVYNEFYEAPKESGWVRGLRIAGGILAGLLSAADSYVAGSAAQAQRAYQAEGNQLGSKFAKATSDAYAARSSAFSGAMMDSFSGLNERKKASQSGRDYNFIMTKRDGDVKLLQVSKMTGKPAGEINLGSNREPNYSVDAVMGKVYYFKGSKTLIGYTIK